ncbi:peptide/nickel transport system substrate-binding protein, partial [Streptomyces sp. Ncost-T6T-2b]
AEHQGGPGPAGGRRLDPGGAAELPKDTKAGSEAEKKDGKDGKDAEADKDSDKETDKETDKDSTDKADKDSADNEAAAERKKADQASAGRDSEDSAASRDEGLYIVGDDNKPGAPAPATVGSASAVHVLGPRPDRRRPGHRPAPPGRAPR